MFEKDLIAIDINKETISILVGTRYKISNGTTIETPRNSFDNGRILDVNIISGAIAPHIKKAKTKDVAFVVRGEDIITRHLNIPFAKDEAMRDSVDFELRQFHKRINLILRTSYYKNITFSCSIIFILIYDLVIKIIFVYSISHELP